MRLLWGEGINLTVLYSEYNWNAEDESRPNCLRNWMDYAGTKQD